MADREAITSESAKFTRTSAACRACRARKQKCSGERPQCAQCRINKARCEWPQQQKRGPPKQYTSALETRLFETENVLIALLSQVSDAQLTAGFHRLEALRRQDVGLPDDAGTLAYARKHKFGPSYWSDFPLRSAEDAKRWSEDRMLGAPDGGGTGSGPRVANTTTSPNQSLDVHFGYPGTQFEEQPDAGDQQEDYDEGMGMMEVVEEEQSSPADLRRSQGAVPGTGESPSTPQRRPDRDAGPGKHRAPSGSFDSAYIW